MMMQIKISFRIDEGMVWYHTVMHARAPFTLIDAYSTIAGYCTILK